MSIEIKKSHKGLLHKKLGVSSKKKIPVETLHRQLQSAKKSGNVTKEREIVFAINARHFHHNK